MNTEVELIWQWPVDRASAEFVTLEVTEFGKVKGGLFGTNKSPSLAETLPNPIVIIGKIVSSERYSEKFNCYFDCAKG